MYFVVTISQTVFQVPLAPFFSLVSISVSFLITYECAIITFAPSSYSSPSSPIPYLVNHTVSLAHSYQQFFFVPNLSQISILRHSLIYVYSLLFVIYVQSNLVLTTIVHLCIYHTVQNLSISSASCATSFQDTFCEYSSFETLRNLPGRW